MDNPSTSPTRRGAANLVKMAIGQMATLAVVTVSGFIIPRFLGAASYGQYAAVLAVVAILQTISSLGLEQVEIRYLAPLWRGPDRAATVTLGSSIWTARLVLAVAAGTGATVWLLGSFRLELGLRVCLLLGALCLLRVTFQATRGLLLPAGHVGKLATLDFLRASLTLPVVLVCFPHLGLAGVFAGLTVLYAALFLAAGAVLMRIIPLRPSRFRWTSLRPYLSYSGATFVGIVAATVSARFTVYAVATWVAAEEAGFLAVGVNFYILARELFFAGRRSLMPILAELEESGQLRRLCYWGGLMMRYGAAGACAVAVGWALIGRQAVAWLLTPAFGPVFPCAAVIFLAVIFFCCGAACVGLLFTRGRADVAAANEVLYAAVTAVGLLLAVRGPDPGVAYRVAWAYAAAAAVYWASTYTSLGLIGGLWLPLRRTLLLILPAALVGPASAWDASLAPRLAALIVFLVLYGGLAVRLGLLPAGEVREIFHTLRRRRGGSEDAGRE